MANKTATIKIHNNTGGNAVIQLYHHNPDTGIQSACYWASSKATVGGLVVKFQTGLANWTDPDYWHIRVTVFDGASIGCYQSQGYWYPFDALQNPFHSVLDDSVRWKECQLQDEDANREHVFEVSTTKFDLKLQSGSTSTTMARQTGAQKISNVFVLMLENHSFDNLFARSGIAGITKATSDNINIYQDKTYPAATSSAPLQMPADPGHEFEDVVEQLCGDGKQFVTGSPYPTINNSGFVANYAQDAHPTPTNFADVMGGFDTPSQLPVIYTLATEFAICDQWFSSMPGPTWPNRYFVHGSSSSGLDHSPSQPLITKWMGADGFSFQNGSIFDSLTNKGLPWRLYIDEQGTYTGGFAQVASLERIQQARDVYELSQFTQDLQWPYGPRYTFIEPNYGDVGGDFSGGSSQHPRDGMYRGEQLIKRVYEAIRNSPAWLSSMLIVIYDEHGGFYDSVKPGAAKPPGDSVLGDGLLGLNQHGFAFDKYGPRVPAVVITPWGTKGTVDKKKYDHSSVPRTLEQLFDLHSLTARDSAAEDLKHLASLTSPRTNCVTSLQLGPADAPLPELTPEQQAERDAELLPESGNEIGFLHVAAKTELELTSDRTERDAIFERVKQIRTRGDLRAYFAHVRARVDAARAAQPGS